MRGFIDKVASASPRFWRWSMNIGIPISIICMGFSVYLIIMSLQYMFDAPQAALLLPGVDIPGSPYIFLFFQGLLP